jgi:hypothetical protein
MTLIRTALVAALACTFGCTSDASLTAPAQSPRSPAVTGSVVADGPTVRLVTLGFYTGLTLPARMRPAVDVHDRGARRTRLLGVRA